MSQGEISYFYLLKAQVAEQFRQRYPGIQKPIGDWKGQEIQDFQEDLIEQVQGRISEKWFYTHIKPETNEKLPRIDMLNLLSRYAGFRDWNDFIFQQEMGQEALPVKQGDKAKSRKFLKSSVFLLLGLLVVSVLGRMDILDISKDRRVTFCVKDAISHRSLEIPPEILWLKAGESPVNISTNEIGCVSLNLEEKEITLVIKAAYYHTDTLHRKITGKSHYEEVMLQPDDYALMIHYFSTQKVADWKKRRMQLTEMIADNARIFQVNPEGTQGLEMYNKLEFINKLTLPLKSLKNIEILELVRNPYGQIQLIRFTQTPQQP